MTPFNTIHVFGASTCLNYTEEHGIGNPLLSWPNILAKKLNLNVKTYAQPGVCNSYIANQVIHNIDNIAKNDLVIVLWVHWSRAMFCVKTDELPKDIKKYSLIFDSHLENSDIKWIRSIGPPKTWLSTPLTQRVYNLPYYDYYFKHYYHEHQKHLESTEKVLLLKLLLEKNKIEYIFTGHDKTILTANYPESKYIVKLIKTANWFFPNNLGLIEISNKNKWYVSKIDQHPNNNGHNGIAQLFYDKIKNNK